MAAVNLCKIVLLCQHDQASSSIIITLHFSFSIIGRIQASSIFVLVSSSLGVDMIFQPGTGYLWIVLQTLSWMKFNFWRRSSPTTLLSLDLETSCKLQDGRILRPNDAADRIYILYCFFAQSSDFPLRTDIDPNRADCWWSDNTSGSYCPTLPLSYPSFLPFCPIANAVFVIGTGSGIVCRSIAQAKWHNFELLQTRSYGKSNFLSMLRL